MKNRWKRKEDGFIIKIGMRDRKSKIDCREKEKEKKNAQLLVI